MPRKNIYYKKERKWPNQSIAQLLDWTGPLRYTKSNKVAKKKKSSSLNKWPFVLCLQIYLLPSFELVFFSGGLALGRHLLHNNMEEEYSLPNPSLAPFVVELKFVNLGGAFCMPHLIVRPFPFHFRLNYPPPPHTSCNFRPFWTMVKSTFTNHSSSLILTFLLIHPKWMSDLLELTTALPHDTSIPLTWAGQRAFTLRQLLCQLEDTQVTITEMQAELPNRTAMPHRKRYANLKTTFKQIRGLWGTLTAQSPRPEVSLVPL